MDGQESSFLQPKAILITAALFTPKDRPGGPDPRLPFNTKDREKEHMNLGSRKTQTV